MLVLLEGFCLIASATRLCGSALITVGTTYVADRAFPEFQPLWSERWTLKNADGETPSYSPTNLPLGAYLHVFVQNTSPTNVSVNDVTLEAVSLSKAIAFSTEKTARRHAASIHFAKLPAAELDRLISAGEPVWWKVDPARIPAGGFAELTIRLRRPMTNSAANIECITPSGSCLARVAGVTSPRLESIGYSTGRDTLYAYASSLQGNQSKPVKILFDGVDVTTRTHVFWDTNVNVGPLMLPLTTPLARGSSHLLQVVYADGSTASATTRAWADEFVYGMWGYINQGETPEARVNYFLGDLQQHNVNAVMYSYGGEVGKYVATANEAKSNSFGIRAMRPGPSKDPNPIYYFLMDEPDAHDFAVRKLSEVQRLGTLGQDVVRTSREFREADATVPQLLNLDNTYKPENWYTYAQLPDVCCADPYFQEQQRIVWNERPAWASAFLKPHYVLGVATICNWACAPKPLHIILNSVCHGSVPGGFRYATPEEKTEELFYALGAGAKAFSYWWYTPYGEFRGCGANEPEAVALWKQIGLLGAQVRTVGPLLTRSCPARIPLKTSAKIWARTLLAGNDNIILVILNDNIASDRLGTVVSPLAKTEIALTLPAWLNFSDAFEISPEGLRDVEAKITDRTLALSLGKTRVGRLVVLTADQKLRERLETRYREQFAGNVTALFRTDSKPASR